VILLQDKDYMFFDSIPEGPPDAVFGLAAAFQADPRPEKVNLVVGIYKNEKLQSELIPSVKKAKSLIVSSDIDYLPIDGLPDFHEVLGPLLFGSKDWPESQSHIYTAQAVGGTGALYLGGAFLVQEVTQIVAIPDPTWANHRSIFERAGATVLTYAYYNKEKHGFDCEAMIASLKKLPEKTAVILQAVCHNPTGCDPTSKEWEEIAQVMLEKRLLPFFDCAYQGFGDGLEEDAKAIRIFKKLGHEMLIAYSCAKNFSLYCQRVGALFVVNKSAAAKHLVASQVKRIIRAIYSNPPAYGARIVAYLLQNPSLKKEWESDLQAMRHRLTSMRAHFIQKLCTKVKKMDFHFLQKHKGMFSFLDLDPKIVQTLKEKFAIYMIGSGRINVAGLTEKNIDYVIDSLIEICE
jgi:aromatic-amino-acid transaminase